MPNIAINGFGRIGRNVLKAGLSQRGFTVVAINDLTEPETLAALLQNDTVFGRFGKKVTSGKGYIAINGKKDSGVQPKRPTQTPMEKAQGGRGVGVYGGVSNQGGG